MERRSLGKYFYSMDKEAILAIPLSTRLQQDSWAWHYENNRAVRSAYHMMVSIKKPAGKLAGEPPKWFKHARNTEVLD
jgi:hypothetical protein